MSANADDHALADMTNKIANVQVDEAALERVKGAKWGTPEGYDYTRYTTGPSDKTAPASEPDQPQADASTWAANAVRYVWEEEFGDVGPQHKELERILFGDEHKMEQGEEFSKLTEIGVTFESETKIKPVASFEDAGLHPVMLANVKLCGYKVPTPIQAYCLPSVLKGIDIIGIAQTGSGKTAAFLIPTLSKLMGKAKKLAAPRPNLTKPWTREDGVRAEPLILIVAPTRELATQIFDEARRLCYRSMLRPCVIYGGAPSGEQMDELRKGCDVLIATPGRLMDFMSRGHLLSLSRVKYTIIDEADEMVSPDWVEEMRNVMGGADANADDDHVYMMFSATFPKEARAVAKEYMSKDHIRIRVLFVDEPKKRDCLFDLLLSMPPARTIVFVNNKKAADFLDDFLYNRGLPSTSIHSDRTQREREDAIRAFRSAKAPLLVATGVSARGLDIKNVMHVINYDLPNSDYGGINEYVHRIGRTARIGNIGMATSFYNDKNEDIAEALTKLLIETHQVVPDFLESYKPENEELKFDDDTDDEGDDAAASDAWGGGTQTNGTANDDASGDAWGTEAPAADTNGGWN
ncbi:MAG: hypothetical protein ASARMPRED_004371 [Alectoria sarmentosa]|nr:MAG: hypothetical protein ASARMPRED_004371 [Alectoria sarmentosa]